MRAVYIHIPFCEQKCYYCDFNSYSEKENLIEKYIDAVIKEIKNYTGDKEKPLYAKTLYFGGGTPTKIDAKYIEMIIKQISCNGEITIEMNPGTVDETKLIKYKEIGINRLSIGLQATQNRLLKNIGRIHTFEEFDNTFKMARKVGFDNINVDLMVGLSGQTLDDVKKSIEYINTISPEHVSVYSLIVHDELVEKHPDAFSNLPEDEEERKMYHYVCEFLTNAGYIQYEISNFAKKGFESKHNLCYWNQEEYYGIGAGASSYINGVRYKNVDNIEKYIECTNELKPELNNRITEEIQDEESKIREYVILKLRLLDGVVEEEMINKYNVSLFEKFKIEIDKLCRLGLIEKYKNEDKYGIKLTKKGLDLANIVWEEFI